MALTNYRPYGQDLIETIQQVRTDPRPHSRIEITICRNGHGYRILDFVGQQSSPECWRGPINAEEWDLDANQEVLKELHRFSQLSEIIAYTDGALQRSRNPMITTHWDATIAFIDVLIEDATGDRRQRMIFAGFEDPVHAEFSIAIDRDVLVHDHIVGNQLYEWQTQALLIQQS